MILVTLGTQKEQFTRLLQKIEDSSIKDEIIVQSGHTNFESKKMKLINFISYEEMDKLIDKADIIITHGGTGSIITPLQKGKKIIACARLKKYNEHIDDHQEEIVSIFSEEGYILDLKDEENLDEKLKSINSFIPKKYESNTDNFIVQLKKEIDEPKKTSLSNKLYIIVLFGILSLGLYSLIRPEREMSVVENRVLSKMKKFTVTDYLSGNFQTNLENTLVDQLAGGETIKKIMNEILNKINALNANKDFCKNDYISIGKGYAIFDCADYIIQYPSQQQLNNDEYFNLRVSELEKLSNKYDLYYYVINNSTTIDFKTNEKTVDLYSLLKNRLPKIKNTGF